MRTKQYALLKHNPLPERYNDKQIEKRVSIWSKWEKTKQITHTQWMRLDYFRNFRISSRNRNRPSLKKKKKQKRNRIGTSAANNAGCGSPMLTSKTFLLKKEAVGVLGSASGAKRSEPYFQMTDRRLCQPHRASKSPKPPSPIRSPSNLVLCLLFIPPLRIFLDVLPAQLAFFFISILWPLLFAIAFKFLILDLWRFFCPGSAPKPSNFVCIIPVFKGIQHARLFLYILLSFGRVGLIVFSWIFLF